jgi:peptide deformylase
MLMESEKIVLLGDQRLRETAIVVDQFDEELSQLAKSLCDTMASANGLGLAAPQIGVSKRVIAVRTGTKAVPKALPW